MYRTIIGFERDYCSPKHTLKESLKLRILTESEGSREYRGPTAN